MKVAETIEIRLTQDQVDKFKAWRKEQDDNVNAARKDKRGPLYGPIGGAYEWRVTPTSIGDSIWVVNTVTRQRIDLSDYETW